MKKYFLTLALIAGTALGALSARADDTNAAAATAVATNPPVTIDQRVSDLEAYVLNSGAPSATGKLAGS
ncbi:MAG TPA: hypothetical protein VFF11_06485, partial [Candidatus Binatia bacterium]|nr:hypothetical protein [Candidatus Binatia bacterium]